MASCTASTKAMSFYVKLVNICNQTSKTDVISIVVLFIVVHKVFLYKLYDIVIKNSFLVIKFK